MSREYRDATDSRYLTGPYRHPLFVVCKSCWALVDAEFMDAHADTHLHRCQPTADDQTEEAS